MVMTMTLMNNGLFSLSVFCQWSPDGRLLLFGLASGEVDVYDSNGNFLVISTNRFYFSIKLLKLYFAVAT